MPVIDTEALPEILMRPGVTGRWLSGHEHGASSVSVLRNWVEPGVAIDPGSDPVADLIGDDDD